MMIFPDEKREDNQYKHSVRPNYFDDCPSNLRTSVKNLPGSYPRLLAECMPFLEVGRSEWVGKRGSSPDLHFSNIYRPHPKDDGRLYFQSVHTWGGEGYPIQPWTGGSQSSLGWGGVPIQPWTGWGPRSSLGRGVPNPALDGGGPNQPWMGGYPNLGGGTPPE